MKQWLRRNSGQNNVTSNEPIHLFFLFNSFININYIGIYVLQVIDGLSDEYCYVYQKVL